MCSAPWQIFAASEQEREGALDERLDKRLDEPPSELPDDRRLAVP